MAKSTSADQLPPSLPLEDRVAIVTGASRGIGRGIALHLASLGAKLVVNYTSNSVQADVSDESQVKSLFGIAETEFKSQASIFVNSAGVMDAKNQAIDNTTVEDFDKNFR